MSTVKNLSDVAEVNKPDYDNFIPRVGITDFEMPVCGHLANISVFVSLEAAKKGISMSRIPIALYATNGVQDLYEFLSIASERIKEAIGTDDVYIKASMKLPFAVTSLVSKLNAHKYYKLEFESRQHKDSPIDFFITSHIDYSSACPCSQSLSIDWLKENKNIDCLLPENYPVPHSQRSWAKSTVKVPYGFEYSKLVYAIEERLVTPTQVLVKREDEQEFAILNGKNPKFVEDAVRSLHDLFNTYKDVEDFVVAVEHQESLHPHNVLSVSYKGTPNGLR